MHTFFYGWRRKMECITLVMACVAMGGWVRSFTSKDQASVWYAPDRGVSFSSESSQFWLLWVAIVLSPELGGRSGALSKDTFHWNSQPALAPPKVDLDLVSPSEVGRNRGVGQFDSHWFGIRVTRSHKDFSNLAVKYARIAIPYWYVVLSLTLLSAYLILRKPRSKASATSRDGVSSEHDRS